MTADKARCLRLAHAIAQKETDDDVVAAILAIEAPFRDALEDMVRQYAYWSDRFGGYTDGGLSALEYAFQALGWSDPHPAPEARCDEPGCMKQWTCGTPRTRGKPGGYRRTCGDHIPKGWPIP